MTCLVDKARYQDQVSRECSYGNLGSRQSVPSPTTNVSRGFASNGATV